MCGRMTLTTKGFDQLATLLEAEPEEPEAAADYRPRYNVAPTDPHWVVRLATGKRRIARARWGVRRDGRPFVNARAETAARLPLWKKAFREARCLVPADGFYEWTGPKKARKPIWFHPKAGGLLLFAGLYEVGREGLSFTVLTTSPDELVATVHDRMPLCLGPEEARAWLESSDVPVGLRDSLVATPVSTRVSSVKNDDPACLDPPVVDEAPPPAQRTLF